jgi:hypothetical protein
VNKFGFNAAVYAVPPPNKKPTHPDTLVRLHGITLADFSRFALKGLIAEGHLTTSNSLFKAAPFRFSEIGGFTSNLDDFANLKKEADALGHWPGLLCVAPRSEINEGIGEARVAAFCPARAYQTVPDYPIYV